MPDGSCTELGAQGDILTRPVTSARLPGRGDIELHLEEFVGFSYSGCCLGHELISGGEKKILNLRSEKKKQ